MRTTLFYTAAHIQNLCIRVAKLYESIHIHMKQLDNLEESLRATDFDEYLEQVVPDHKIGCFYQGDEAM